MRRISFESPNGVPGILHIPDSKKGLRIVTLSHLVRENAGRILTFHDLRVIISRNGSPVEMKADEKLRPPTTKIQRAFRKGTGKPEDDAEAARLFRERLKGMAIDPSLLSILKREAEERIAAEAEAQGLQRPDVRFNKKYLFGQADDFRQYLEKACRLPLLSDDDEIKLALFIERTRDDWREMVMGSPAVQDRAYAVLQRFALRPEGHHPFKWVNTKERKQQKHEIARSAIIGWGKMEQPERMRVIHSIDFTDRWVSKQQRAMEKLSQGIGDKRLSAHQKQHLQVIAGEDPKALHSRIALAAEREQEWIRAKEHMAMRNTRLVVSIAAQYKLRGLPLMDLVQEGNEGLLVAIEHFDVGRGNRFSTYATWWIRQSIVRSLQEQPNLVRMKNAGVRKKIHFASEMLTKEHERSPTQEEIASAAHVSIHDVRDFYRGTFSLDAPVGEGEDTSFGDLTLEDNHERSAAEHVDTHALHAQIKKVLNMLTYRERCILQLRLGLGDGNPYTLEECGRVFKVTRERVRQIETSAYKKLRDPRRARHLAPFVQEFLMQNEAGEEDSGAGEQ